jgi:predicted GNAT family acetyltransferase
MNVVRHNTAAEFINLAGAWLEIAEAENNLILGIAGFFASSAAVPKIQPYFLTIENKGTFHGAALMTPPRQLLISDMDDSAVTALADYLLAESAPVPGLVGRNSKAQLFANYWTKRTGQSCHVKRSDRLYVCQTVESLNSPPGRLRPALMDDETLLSQWCVQFCLDAGIEDETVHFKARLPSMITNGSLFIWENNDAVAMAGFERQTVHGIAISWVYTPAHVRRSGYATACVAALTQRMLDSDKKFCCLYTDLANPTSNSIYQKIGYRPVCDVQHWIFE